MTETKDGHMSTTGRTWEPMKLDYVGQVGTLMRGATGSKQDSHNTCVTRKASHVGVGTTCP
jgi:hypothetical protein